MQLCINNDPLIFCISLCAPVEIKGWYVLGTFSQTPNKNCGSLWVRCHLFFFFFSFFFNPPENSLYIKDSDSWPYIASYFFPRLLFLFSTLLMVLYFSFWYRLFKFFINKYIDFSFYVLCLWCYTWKFFSINVVKLFSLQLFLLVLLRIYFLRIPFLLLRI